MKPVFNTIWEYKGKQYRIFSIGKMKDPTERTWLPAVFYWSEDEQMYCRELEEFIKLFKEIKL